MVDDYRASVHPYTSLPAVDETKIRTPNAVGGGQTRAEALAEFRHLVVLYGIPFTPDTVPDVALERMRAVNLVLTEADRRQVLEGAVILPLQFTAT